MQISFDRNFSQKISATWEFQLKHQCGNPRDRKKKNPQKIKKHKSYRLNRINTLGLDFSATWKSSWWRPCPCSRAALAVPPGAGCTTVTATGAEIALRSRTSVSWGKFLCYSGSQEKLPIKGSWWTNLQKSKGFLVMVMCASVYFFSVFSFQFFSSTSWNFATGQKFLKMALPHQNQNSCSFCKQVSTPQCILSEFFMAVVLKKN